MFLEVFVEKVEKEGDRYYAISSNSPFYVDYKGGQLGDRGYIGNSRVLRVFEKDGKIYHEIDREIEEGSYEIEIDEEHRNFVKAHHTAQHILSAALHEIAEINTVGFRMGFEYTTVDLDVPFVNDMVLKEAEELSNDVVKRCINVEEVLVDREDVGRFKLRKPLSEKVEGKVRIIKIGEFDYSPCGGFHVKNTGEIGVIKVLKQEKIKGNLTRLYFVASSLALKYFWKYNNILRNISKTLTSSISEIEEKVSKTLDELKMCATKVDKLSSELAKYKVKELKKKGNVYYLEGERNILRYIPKYFDKEGALLVLYDGRSYNFTSTGGYNVKKIIEQLKNIYGGSGGGSKVKGNYVSDIDFNRLLEVLV
ncbi:threonyl-tRNA synthetase [Thermosipho melanesiensis]|uniref:alanyl-tRNA editing protein n=1 Tax=Thermosipho melanesiensis TaxID=46541 RepID=UPI00059ED694|nr:threonyl-tRNA synthetase [Thermosipho melanesiensis]OOC38467.1 threonyl-tRNA synthetase [Thermosipho melanesiensis]OOC38929.1 threonyl-tRNA synthetase [Thermosipho melanesiensis]OOC41567.1 threonyl-tRNA synthetase [Thermosipho melanesiensis]OOC44056.1 threonyl-tRNA synthetase [Thermosipho melanesiensis]